MFDYLIGFGLIFIVDVLLDWYNIEKRQRQIKHGVDTLLAAIAYTAVATFSACQDIKGAGERGPEVTLDHTLEALGFLIVWAAVRSIWHDVALNLLRGKPIDYLGTEQTSAGLDKWLNERISRGWNQYTIKIAALIVCIIIALLLNFLK